MGFFYATLALNRLAVYETFLKTLRNEGVIQMPDKDVLKKRFLIYFMIVAFISPGKFSKIVFPA